MIRSEFRKLTTIRGPWLLLAAGPLIVVAGVTGLVVSGGNVQDPAVQSQALAHVGLAAMLTLIFGILAVAGEYRHGTITDTYLSFPARGRVVTAKLGVYALVGAAAGLVSSVVALAVTAARRFAPPPIGRSDAAANGLRWRFQPATRPHSGSARRRARGAGAVGRRGLRRRHLRRRRL